jgi:hypothetical protein
MAVWLQTDAGAPIQITPAQFNVRSRVHEYGGSPYIVAAGMLFFVNFNDQALYSIALDKVGFASKEAGVARQITPQIAVFAMLTLLSMIQESSHLRQGRSPSG